jgi:endo-1,4-beta-D-glucanase Y
MLVGCGGGNSVRETESPSAVPAEIPAAAPFEAPTEKPADLPTAEPIPTEEAVAAVDDGNGGNSERPFFPIRQEYHAGVVLPSISRESMEAVIVRTYTDWKSRYFWPNKHDDTQAYIYTSGETDGLTVSEAHGYGMLIIAAMAGFDEHAQRDFDRLVRFFLAHPSSIEPRLMAWNQTDDGTGMVDINGVNSATDGDLDIAYAFLMADRLWGSDGEFNYFEMGLSSINGTMDSIINKDQWVVTMGDWGQWGNSRFSTRPADFMLQHFRTFEAVTGDGRWDSVIENVYAAVEQLVENYAPETGLLPNFARLDREGFHPTDFSYSWDSCRTPWRIAMDYIIHGNERMLPQLQLINAWIREAANGEPRNVRSGYMIETGEVTGQWESLAFTGPFMVAAMVGGENQEWLDALWRYNANPGAYSNYYSSCIRILCMLVASGNWWAPEAH